MSIFIPGPVGALEARFWRPSTPARAAAVVCHPHPLHGGSMHSTVAFRIARALQSAGVAVLRFNFRGVGRSAGSHHGAGGEVEDARAALDWLAVELPGLPQWAAGFSFGARTVAALAASEPRIARVILIALPVAVYDCSVIEGLHTPGLICQAGADDFGNLAALRERHPTLDAALELREIAGADHFFKDQIDELQAVVAEAAARWPA